MRLTTGSMLRIAEDLRASDRGAANERWREPARLGRPIARPAIPTARAARWLVGLWRLVASGGHA